MKVSPWQSIAPRPVMAMSSLGVDEAALVEAGGVLGAPEVGHDLGIVVAVGRAQQHCVALDAQLHAVLQADHAGQEASLGEGDASAAVTGAVVNGGLKRFGVHGHAVAECAVVLDKAVEHGKILLNNIWDAMRWGCVP